MEPTEMETTERSSGGRASRGRDSSLRTRSQAAPDWTLQESLILVNEVVAVERDCHNTLSSFQKWKIIVENCHALEVNRSLSQCRRQWESLLADYNKINLLWGDHHDPNNGGGESYWSLDRDEERRQRLGLPESFSIELFRAIDEHVREFEDDGCGGTDQDSDPDAGGDDLLLSVIALSGAHKQKHRENSQKRCIEETIKPQKRIKSEKKIHKESSSEDIVESLSNNFDGRTIMGESSQEEKLQMMPEKLRETAELINSIVKGRLSEADYRLTDLSNLEAVQTDFIRRQGDKLINCLGDLQNTLDQLCTLV